MSPHMSLRYFSPREFNHYEQMQPKLLTMLDDVRHHAGVPIHITSDLRHGDSGAHGRGWAVDITDDTHRDGVKGRWVWKIVEAALHVGFTRIGIYDGHIHLDFDPTLPPRVMWGGCSS